MIESVSHRLAATCFAETLVSIGLYERHHEGGARLRSVIWFASSNFSLWIAENNFTDAGYMHTYRRAT